MQLYNTPPYLKRRTPCLYKAKKVYAHNFQKSFSFREGFFVYNKFLWGSVYFKSYPIYGGKGIRVEESFSTFHKFIDWAIEQGYQPDMGLEIDRRDSSKGYSIENCRWVTKLENGLNVRYINLTLEDIRWIRSDDFTYEKAEKKFIASRNTIENIREGRTFVEVPII